MGVTIHYRGRLNNIELLPQMLTELSDIAQIMEWECRELDDDWSIASDARFENGRIVGHLGLKGVQLQPHPDTEALTFFFTRDGVLATPGGIALANQGASGGFWSSVKTQFAPPEIHILVVGLLKYLKRKYISDIEVADEGQYWETGSREILVKHMETINAAMNRVEKALSSCDLGDLSGLSGDQIADLIERLIRGS